MSTTTLAALVTGAVTDFGTAGLTILTATIGIAVALLVFRFGWKKLRGSAR